MSVDFTQLGAAVREAAEQAWSEVRASRPNERFYAFALYTDDGAMTIEPAANTEEAFERKAAPYPKEASYYRWATGEWAYEASGSDAFQRAYDLLNVEDRYEEAQSGEEDDSNFAAFQSRVVETMISALGELDAAGFFGRGSEREQVTLFVSISDSDESETIEDASARRLNSASVYDQFARRHQ